MVVLNNCAFHSLYPLQQFFFSALSLIYGTDYYSCYPLRMDVVPSRALDVWSTGLVCLQRHLTPLKALLCYRSIQRLESSAHMESAHKSKEAKARGSTQGLWRAILGDLAAHAYLESCKSFADFNYIDFFISRKVNDWPRINAKFNGMTLWKSWWPALTKAFGGRLFLEEELEKQGSYRSCRCVLGQGEAEAQTWQRNTRSSIHLRWILEQAHPKRDEARYERYR